MNTDLTPEHIQAYQDNGFVVVDDFLNSDELEQWRTYVDEAIAQRADRKLADGRMKDGDAYYDKVFVQRINLWQDHDGMRELMHDSRLGKMAATLAGVDGIRIWHDQALVKMPWGNPTGWHLDNPYWSFSSRNAISIWVALDDATLNNGCLYFIPGSHKTATYDNTNIGQNIGDLFEVYTDWATQEATPAPMKAGSCSFHNGLVAHGAGANMTPGKRRAMTCAYMPDGSTFNGRQNILPPDIFASLNEGDLLNHDELNPLIYHKNRDD